MAQVLAWRKQMAHVQKRKEGQRIEIYPNPLIFFGTVELPTQYCNVVSCHAISWIHNVMSCDVMGGGVM